MVSDHREGHANGHSWDRELHVLWRSEPGDSRAHLHHVRPKRSHHENMTWLVTPILHVSKVENCNIGSTRAALGRVPNTAVVGMPQSEPGTGKAPGTF